jgi:mitogen-activated protein kinase 1/3
MICDFGLSRSLPESYIDDSSFNTTLVRKSVLSLQTDEKLVKKQITNLLQFNKERVGAMKRQMSMHVVTRWYRPPEICILDNIYDQAIDIWSLGCCLFELACSIRQNNNK